MTSLKAVAAIVLAQLHGEFMENVNIRDLQFYPTPPELARRAWSLFKNKDFKRVLETSAGNGDLIKVRTDDDYYNRRSLTIDCCEIDINKHPLLRSIPGVSIVGMDFLTFGPATIYSHVIQNPPFSQGCDFVLKAWDTVWDAELVSIINAETLRNPYSRERQRLVALVEQFGSVEYIEGAFACDESQRKTTVEVALIYLKKTADVGEFNIHGVIDNLQRENESSKAEKLAAGFDVPYELAIPSTVIENFVMSFNAAVQTMRDSVMSECRAAHYASRMGKTMSEIQAENEVKTNKPKAEVMRPSVEWVRQEMMNRYISLKERGWTSILHSSEVMSKLSEKAQVRVRAEFDKIKELEFTETNIQGFLLGLMENQNAIKMDMVCDIFDLITKYHSDNLCFYMGWKSNSLHRTCGMRLKTTRFIIPNNSGYSFGLDGSAMAKLGDIDKVFAILDGRDLPEYGLVDAFKNQFNNLKYGARVSTSYMDVRYYPGVNTIHFFPTKKELIEKLNVLVGNIRKWLPPSDASVSDAFWTQFKMSEKFDKEVRAEVDRDFRNKRIGSRISSWDHPLMRVGSSDESDSKRSMDAINGALNTVLERHGIEVEFQLENESTNAHGQLLLEV